MMWLLAITFFIVGCTVIEQPLVGPSEQTTSDSQEGETTLARIGLRIDPRSGTVSQISPGLSDNTGRITLLTGIINDNFDFVGATCPDCGSPCAPSDTRRIVIDLVVKSDSPNLTNIARVNATTSAIGFVSLIPSPNTPEIGILMPGDDLFPEVTVELPDCNPFNVFFDLQGEEIPPPPDGDDFLIGTGGRWIHNALICNPCR